jgi:hypothetical protein
LSIVSIAAGATLAYVGIIAVIRRTVTGADDLLEGYPMWSYHISWIHSAFVLPGLLFSGLYTLSSSSKTESFSGVVQDALSFLCGFVNGDSGSSFNAWLTASWGSPQLPTGGAETIVFGCIVGYMFKDFVVYEKGLDGTFLVHHVLTILGGTLSLCFDAGAGLACIIAVFAEFGSTFYCTKTMYPESRVFEALYFVVMGWSNCFAAWGGIRLFLMEDLSAHYRYAYMGMLVLLEIFRCTGWYMLSVTPLLARLGGKGSKSKQN